MTYIAASESEQNLDLLMNDQRLIEEQEALFEKMKQASLNKSAEEVIIPQQEIEQP